MLRSLVFAFTMFHSIVAAGNRIIVVLNPNQDQLQRMSDKKGTLRVRSELMRPLSAERLEELENVAGMSLFDDVGYIALGGRILRTGQHLSKLEVDVLVERLETVSWVKYANPDTIVRHNDPPLP